MKALVACLLSAGIAANAVAGDFAREASRLIGFTIIASKTITGYVDRDGKRGDSFEGCNYGRKIIFDDRTYLTCSTYSYSYSYRPDAVILSNRTGNWVMFVEGDKYDMSN